MNKCIKGNKILMAIILIVLIALGMYLYYRSAKIDALALQAKCADRAAYFYKEGWYKKDTPGFSDFYTNHWNQKLGKCFIQITSTSLNDGFETIDLFDAFEGKRFAVYMGHQSCEPAFLVVLGEPKLCQLDSGSIWFDGNDTRNPADYHIGFKGIANGPGTVDENIQKQFLEHIQPFMTE